MYTDQCNKNTGFCMIKYSKSFEKVLVVYYNMYRLDIILVWLHRHVGYHFFLFSALMLVFK